MKIARFDDDRIGVVRDDAIFDVTALVGATPGEWPPVAMCRVIADFATHRAKLETAAGPAKPLASVRLLTPVPWQRFYLAIFAAFLGTVGENFVIDTDHWRHFWMMLGAMWGMFAAAQPYKRSPASAVSGGLEPAS